MSDGSGKRILLVDDQRAIVQYLAGILKAGGYDVDSASDGEEALARARASAPDMVICDVLMPVMDGFTLLRHWKSDPSLQAIPFVVCSATFLDDANERHARNLGADAFVRHPVKPQELLDVVQEVFQTAPACSARGTSAEHPGDYLLGAYGQALVRKLDAKTRELAQANSVLQADIRARQEAEAALGLLNAVVMQSKESILITDAELELPGPRIVFVNAAFSQMTGYTADEVVGKTPRILQGPATDRGEIQRLKLTLRRGETFDGEAIMYRKDGTSYVQEWRVSALRDGAGKITHYAAFQRDVSERKRIMDALRESEGKLRDHAEQLERKRQQLVLAQRVAKIGSWETDLVTMAVSWSDETHRIFQTDADHFQPTHARFLERVHPEDRARVDAAFVGSFDDLNPQSIEHRIVLPDLSVRIVEERWQVFCDETGTPARAIGTCQDITERSRLNAALAESETRFREIAENIPAVFFLRTPDSAEYLYVSPIYEAIWGRSCASLYAAPMSWTEAIVPGTLSPILPEEVGGDTFRLAFEFQIRRPDGSTRWIHSRGFPIFNPSGQVERVAGLAEDITERKEQEHKIARLNRVRAMAHGFSSAIIRRTDRRELLQEVCRITVNAGAFKVAWVTPVEPAIVWSGIVGAAAGSDDDAPARELDGGLLSKMAQQSGRPVIVDDFSADPSFASISDALLAERIRSGAAFPLFASGRIVAILVLLASECHVFDPEEKALLEWLTSDLSYALEHIDYAQQLQHLAYFDPLTGLANARLFADRLSQFINVARQSKHEVAVVLIDIERFTNINDTFGRDQGDRVLRAIGERLQEFLIEPFALGRISADTFAAASPGAGESIAARLRDQMLDAFGLPFAVGDSVVQLMAQAGIAVFPGDAHDEVSLFTCAEAALKLAKSSAARYAYYSKVLNERAAHRVAMETQLRDALVKNQFVLHYQPRVNMHNGEIVGAEALIRWEHPTRGMMAPAEFIELAEETGLIILIGVWVIDEICRRQAAWIKAGVPVVPIAANLSSVQLDKSDIVKTLQSALTRHGLEPGHIHVELTESAVMQDADGAVATLTQLRDLGVGLALDDFGTGYSSLAYLKRFPFGRVKIDRSFVTEITHSAEDAGIASAIIAIAHRMGIKVVAEGIETEGQFKYLLSQGCDEMQGFYFSEAVCAEEFEKYLRERKRLPLEVQRGEDQPTILVVDDEPGIRAALRRTFRPDGYRVLTAASGTEGLELLALHHVQVVISDQRMPEMSGTEFLSKVKQLYPDTIRIVLSGYTDLGVVTDAVNRGAVFRFLTKPWDDEALREQIRDAFRFCRSGKSPN